MNTSKGTERVNEKGAVEINVETVDYRTPAGRDKEPDKEKVEVTHLIRTNDDDDDNDKKPGARKVVSEAAGKVAEKLHSAKEAISERTTGDKKTQ